MVPTEEAESASARSFSTSAVAPAYERRGAAPALFAVAAISHRLWSAGALLPLCISEAPPARRRLHY